MFRFRNAWGALGAMLGLIALYLVLVNGTNSVRVISAGGRTLREVFETLQGR